MTRRLNCSCVSSVLRCHTSSPISTDARSEQHSPFRSTKTTLMIRGGLSLLVARDSSSVSRRNTGVKFLCRGFKSQGLAWPLIELAGHFVEMGLRVHRQVGSFRKILSQQTIGVLVGIALPWTLRIAKVNIDVGR